jgi:hypothetical protein
MHKPMTTFIYLVITISYAEGWGFSNTQLITTANLPAIHWLRVLKN